MDSNSQNEQTEQTEQNERNEQIQNKQTTKMSLTSRKVTFADPPHRVFSETCGFDELTPEEARQEREMRSRMTDTHVQDQDRERRSRELQRKLFLEICACLEESLSNDMCLHPGRVEPSCMETEEHLVLKDGENCALCGARVVFDDR